MRNGITRSAFVLLAALSANSVGPAFVGTLAGQELPSRAHAQSINATEYSNYTVQPGDTCTRIATRFYGDRRRYDLIHHANPELGPPPHRLRAGQVLRLPRLPRNEAEIVRTHRIVETRAPTSPGWARARRGAPLSRGHQVVTRDHSSAEVRWRDGSLLAMRERTLLIVHAAGRRTTRSAPRRARLEHGALRAHLAALAGVAVHTPSSVATVEGGDVLVDVDAEGASRVANLGGRAEVSANDTTVTLPVGTGTVVQPGRTPSAPRRLPPPPRWANDLAGRFVGVSPGGGTLRGSWHPVDGAQRYRVEVSRQADGRELVASVEVDASQNQFAIHHLEAGTYYVSVATIDTEFLEGRSSPRRAMVVREARIVPPGGGEPPADEYDPGDPSLPFSAPRILVGTMLVAPLGFRCHGRGTTPATIVTLRQLGPQRVKCFDSAGREVPGFGVDVVRATAHTSSVVTRGTRHTVVMQVGSPLRLPRQLVALGSAGVAIGPVLQRPDGDYETEIVVTHDAPDDVIIPLAVASGSERIEIARLRIATTAPAIQPTPAPRAVPPHPSPVQDPAAPFDQLALPDQLALRGPSGARVWAAFGFISDERLRKRLNVGAATPEFKGVSLFARVGMELAGNDQRAPHSAHGDAIAGTQIGLWQNESFDLRGTFEAWLPTGPSAGGLAATRLAPAVQLDFRRGRLALRTRQGFIGAFAPDATRLWASSYGADALFENWTVGLEIDSTMGSDHSARLRTAVAAGASASFAWKRLHLSGAGRVGLTPDAATMLGRWALLFSASVDLD